MAGEDRIVSGGQGEHGHQKALVAVAVLAGFAGLVSTTSLVLAGQYVRLIIPVSFLSGLAFVVAGFVIASRFEPVMTNTDIF
jgi:hypothetical protein